MNLLHRFRLRSSAAGAPRPDVADPTLIADIAGMPNLLVSWREHLGRMAPVLRAGRTDRFFVPEAIPMPPRRESALTHADGTKTKHWHARTDGATLIQTTRTGDGKPKETSRTLASAEAAHFELDKLERKRFADDYFRAADPAAAPPGTAVFECYGPVLHDLSADGSLLVLARYGPGKQRWGRLDVVDTRTGIRRTVFEEPAAPIGPYFHAALFDHTAESLTVQMESTTFRIDIRTGTRTPLAAYQEWRTARFNPYVLRPSQDTARRRLVVFDAGNIVRVLEGDRTLLEVSTASPTADCRGARISPSGRLLAVYRVSRGLVYQHADAQADFTNTVDIWDIDTGRVQTTLAMTEKDVGQVGIDSADEHLIVALDTNGPAAYSLATGTMVWRYGGPGLPYGAMCYGWTCSPDGSLLAVGRPHEVALHRLPDREPVPYPDAGAYRPQRMIFSADGRVFAAERMLNVVVRKTP